MGWQTLILKLLTALLMPLVDKLWDLVDAWISGLKQAAVKKKDDKEIANETAKAAKPGGRPGN